MRENGLPPGLARVASTRPRAARTPPLSRVLLQACKPLQLQGETNTHADGGGEQWLEPPLMASSANKELPAGELLFESRRTSPQRAADERLLINNFSLPRPDRGGGD